jgi:hypothetical protein
MAIKMEALTQAHTVQGTCTAATSVTGFAAGIGAVKLPVEVLMHSLLVFS